jgi:hypothetical protein
MKANQRIRKSITLGGAVLLLMMFTCMLPVFTLAQKAAPKAKSLAQKLVEDTQAKHPELDEVGISANTASGCRGVASTDKSDIGEKCEKDDLAPMQMGKPFVEKEKNGYDVSVPLHDSTGEIIGTLGIGFKPAAGQTESSLTAQAQKIAAEMEAQIPSKAKLLARAE